MNGAVSGSDSDEMRDTLVSGSQSGIWTSETLTEKSLQATGAWLMSLAPGFHASPFQLPDSSEPQTTNATCGPRPSSAFAWYDPDTASLRMSQGSLPGMDTSVPSSETWPRAGTMLAGDCYHRPSWEQTIGELVSGLFPTPTTGGTRRKRWDEVGGSGARTMMAKYMTCEEMRGHRNPEYLEWQLDWPIKWTDSERLAGDKIQVWRQQHGDF